MNVLFLGYGKMGSTLGEAWLAQGVASRIVAVDPLADQKDFNAALVKHIEQVTSCGFDLIIVAVKPALVDQVLSCLPAQMEADTCVVSLAAGVTTQRLQAALHAPVPVVRAMPNTAVQVLAGCTGLYAGRPLTAKQHDMITTLFDSVGHTYWLEQESELDAVTAISGSGPAYYHLFSEALADSARALGLPAGMATDLAKNTALGAATLQCTPGADLAALRQNVTSPNGTTHAAIETFEHQNRLRDLIASATQAAYRRSIELSKPEKNLPSRQSKDN